MTNLQSLPILLKELCLNAMACSWQEVAHKAIEEQWQPEEYLAALCEIEAGHRYESRLKRLLRDSKLPSGKQLSHEISGISAQQIKLKTQNLDWVRQGHNMILFGASGLGKTHLAAALGYELLEQSIRVKFTSSTALVKQLQKTREELGLEDALKKLDKYELLILDDIGYVKKSDSESQVFVVVN
jgi:DNA replication protein DnaC